MKSLALWLLGVSAGLFVIAGVYQLIGLLMVGDQPPSEERELSAAIDAEEHFLQ